MRRPVSGAGGIGSNTKANTDTWHCSRQWNKPWPVSATTWSRSNARPEDCCASRLICPGAAPSPKAAAAGAPEPFVTVEDCEKVTRQLQFALEVDGADYKRLEVSSPGIDRPLRNEQDFERFVGEVIDITLKAPMGAAAGRPGGGQPQEISRHAGAGRGADGSRAGRSSGAMRPSPSPDRRSARSARRRRCRRWALHWTSCAKRGSRPIVDFKGRRPKPVGSYRPVASPD